MQLGARDLSGARQTVRWTAGTASDGVSAGPTSGSLVVPKGGDQTQSVAITAPTAEGRYTQTFAFTDGTVIGGFDSVYVVTLENGHWGVKIRSSFAP